jgi:hypothetical protein
MSNLYKILTVIGIVLFSANLSAQAPAQLTGQLKSKQKDKALPFATVAIYKSGDTKPLKGTTTNDKGFFSLENIPPAQYLIQFSYVGYAKEVKEIIIEKKKKIYELGTVFLKESENTIDEVSVTGDKRKGADQLDKTLFYLNKDIRETATNGLEVLSYVPSVSTDIFGGVSLEGRSDILFQVNGLTRDKEFITQLSPANIDHIEIITNPSAKYDASVSGVINIILINEKKSGLSGTLIADIPTPKAQILNPQLSLDYGTDKFRFYLKDHLHREFFHAESEEITRFKEQNYEITKKGSGILGFNRNNLNTGFDLFLNESNTLNFNLNHRIRHTVEKDYTYNIQEFSNEQLIREGEAEKNLNQNGTSAYYSVFYKKTFSKGHALSMETGYYDYNGRDLNSYDYVYINPETSEIINQYNRGERVVNNNSNIPVKIDYIKTFEKSKLEAGYKGLNEWYDNELFSESDANVMRFKYREMRHAGYASYTSQIGKYKVQGGLRAEYSDILIDQEQNSNYFTVLPQFSVFRKLENSQTLKFSARRRIYRPSIHALNDFESAIDSIHVIKGNPELGPAFSNNLELSYSKNFKSNYIQPKIFAKYLTDAFNDINYTENGITVTQTQNIGKTWLYGAGLTSSLQLGKYVKLNSYMSVYNKIIENQENYPTLSAENKQKLTFHYSANVIISPGKKWHISLMSNYSSPRIDYQEVASRNAILIMSVNKEIFKNAKLTLMAVPPYTKEFKYRKTVSENPELFRSKTGTLDLSKGMAAIIFSYNFHFGEKVNKLNRQMENQDKNSGGIL